MLIKFRLIKSGKNLHRFAKKYWNKLLKKTVSQSYPIKNLFPNHEKNCPIQPETMATPEATQMIFINRAKDLQGETYTTPDIYTTHLNRVIYCPRYDLILTKSRKLIRESLSGGNLFGRKADHTFNFQEINPSVINPFHLYFSKLEQISRVSSVIRGYYKNHYHTLVDAIPRLYLLNQPQYQDIEEIQLLFSSEPTPIERFFVKKLALENVKVTVVENFNRLYLLETLIFPTFMSQTCCGYLPSVYLDYFRDRVLPKRESKKVNRIFISRAKARHGRTIINENELFAALQPYGFNKYLLEDLPIEAQIELFYDAEYIVGAFGAGLTNMIFSDKTKVLDLSPSWCCNPYYYYLAKSLGHTYGYCYGNPENPDLFDISNFSVNVSEVVERLLELEKQYQYKNTSRSSSLI